MKKLWARVGMTFEVSDEDYELIEKAIKNKDRDMVSRILFNNNHYADGDSYLPVECEDNPNKEEFEF